ncbi:hypothetical protein [Catenibacterium mitsuokai]|uniref:hypothetical protein n=1 Tax=Catenibacterium mitsuokai TaxID=100886 RepID=UPI0022E58173|nr:hypothetical protein [Catenibacterium mitsuokai]
MSYSIGIYVKVEGCDKYVEIAEPFYASPSYNLGMLFRSCMDWDFKLEEYYKCDHVIEHLDRGIKELRYKPYDYAGLIPGNDWQGMPNALYVLDSIKDCILEQAEEIPLDCMYMNWG